MRVAASTYRDSRHSSVTMLQTVFILCEPLRARASRAPSPLPSQLPRPSDRSRGIRQAGSKNRALGSGGWMPGGVDQGVPTQRSSPIWARTRASSPPCSADSPQTRPTAPCPGRSRDSALERRASCRRAASVGEVSGKVPARGR